MPLMSLAISTQGVIRYFYMDSQAGELLLGGVRLSTFMGDLIRLIRQ